MKLPACWILIKYSNRDKPVWFRAKKGRNDFRIMQYFRKKTNFVWGKVYDQRTKQKIFWFNKMDSGTSDRGQIKPFKI